MGSSFLLKGGENIVFAITTEEENPIDQGLFLLNSVLPTQVA